MIRPAPCPHHPAYGSYEEYLADNRTKIQCPVCGRWYFDETVLTDRELFDLGLIDSYVWIDDEGEPHRVGRI